MLRINAHTLTLRSTCIHHVCTSFCFIQASICSTRISVSSRRWRKLSRRLAPDTSWWLNWSPPHSMCIRWLARKWLCLTGRSWHCTVTSVFLAYATARRRCCTWPPVGWGVYPCSMLSKSLIWGWCHCDISLSVIVSLWHIIVSNSVIVTSLSVIVSLWHIIVSNSVIVTYHCQ